MVACDGGQTLRGKLFHTDGTDTEQRKCADYFNVKEFPNPEWVWADCFHGKQFVTSFACVTVTHCESGLDADMLIDRRRDAGRLGRRRCRGRFVEAG